jgi:anaerobic magnesium-protoporphyrin IX monomethyl ester cyclase
MVGLPGETKETLKQTAEFAASLKILFGYHYLAPFPGTTLCEKVEEYDLEILTKDWAKYDANDAIVKTSSLGPQDIRDFVALYDEAMEGHWQNVLDGYKNGKNTPLDNLRVEGQWRMNLTFKILKDDLIEKHGFIGSDTFMGSKENALNELCRRVTDSTSAEPRVVNQAITDFVQRGYLNAEELPHGYSWFWAGTEKSV